MTRAEAKTAAMTEAPDLKPRHIIKEGDTVIFDENGEKKAFIKIRKNGTVKVGKSHVSMEPFIGAPFGAVFTLTADGKGVERVTECPKGEWASQMVTTTGRTNEGLFDRNEANQKLSTEDIEAMKAAGKAGHEIVQALCRNSATFHQKTEFAQEKYKKKKEKKYICQVTLRRPTARTIAEAYFEKGPDRVHNLRPDTLAMMLSLGNVAAGAKVLVLDTCMGVVTAAVVERLGGLGSVCNTYTDRPVTMDASKSLNLAPAQARTWCSAALHMLHEVKALGPALPAGMDGAAEPAAAAAAAADPAPASAAADAGGSAQGGKDGKGEGGEGGEGGAQVDVQVDAMEVEGAAAAADAVAAAQEQEGKEAAQPGGVEQAAQEAVAGEGAAGPGAVASGAEEQRGQKRGRQGQPKGNGQGGKGREGGPGGVGTKMGPKTGLLHSLVYPGFTSAVIAAPKLQATAVMQAVMPLLAPSASFVVYSPSVQPLADCLHHLRTSHQAVMLQLHESWLRPYQVLPARTHPHMMCDGTGGFILSGIKVVSTENPSPAVAAANKGGPRGKQAAGGGKGQKGQKAQGDVKPKAGSGGAAQGKAVQNSGGAASAGGAEPKGEEEKEEGGAAAGEKEEKAGGVGAVVEGAEEGAGKGDGGVEEVKENDEPDAKRRKQ